MRRQAMSWPARWAADVGIRRFGFDVACLAALVVATVLIVRAAEANAAACANEAIRERQGSAYLADCRAYEMVSPPDKNSSDVATTASRIQSSPSGEAVTYISSGAFAGAPGTGAVAQYLSSRGADGWSTRAINPFQKTNGYSFVKNSGFKSFDANLEKGVFVGGEPILDPSAPPGVRNLYVDTLSTNSFSVLTTKGSNPLFGMFFEPYFAAASEDYSHVIFEDTAALTDDAPDDGSTKLYESNNGAPQFVGILPGDTPAGGSIAGNGAGQGPFQPSNRYTGHTLSADGSRVVFKDATTGQLYSRVNGTTTLHVSASQRTDCATSPGSCTGTPEPDPAGPLPVVYRDASADGKRILFSSCEKLTDDSTATLVGGECEFVGSEDLYQYDAESGDLTVLSKDTEPADGNEGKVLGTMGESGDGSTVYFVAQGRLTSDTESGADSNLYVWRSGDLHFVAGFGGDDGSLHDLWDQRYQTGISARVSVSGRYALFADSAAQPGVDNGGERQLYLYDAVSDELQCVSCGSGVPNGRAELSQESPGVVAGKNEYPNRALLADGRKVFFSTSASLVPQDINGRYDAYEWDRETGAVSLISSGSAPVDSYFVEASADGRDVFFTTRQRLSRADVDNNVDLYDARSGGGFPEPPPPASDACEGERCQGEPGSGQKGQLPGTAGVNAGADANGRSRRGGGNRLTVTSAKTARGPSAVISVHVPSSGRLRASGHLLKPTSRAVSGPGNPRLKVSLSRAGKRRLQSRGVVEVRVRIRFQPSGGQPRTAQTKVKFMGEKG